MSLQDMASCIRDMPKQEEMMKSFQIHIDILNKVITEITKNRLQKIVQLEQMIISGLEGTTTRQVNNTAVVKGVSQISKELQQKDYLRVLMVYFCVFDLSSKDKETMLKSLEKESYREIVRNMEYLDV